MVGGSRWGWSRPLRACPHDPDIEIFLKRSPATKVFLISPFFFPNLWKTKPLSGNTLGPVGVSTVFTHSVLQTETQQWPGKILEKGEEDSSYLIHVYSQASLSQTDLSSAKRTNCSWHVQNAFINKDNNSMSCLSCLKGSRSVFFPEYTINQIYLGLAGWFFSAFLRDISDDLAQCSKVTQTVHVLSESEHSQDSGKNFPFKSDGQRSGFCGCSRLLSLLGCN